MRNVTLSAGGFGVAAADDPLLAAWDGGALAAVVGEGAAVPPHAVATIAIALAATSKDRQLKR